MKHKFITNFTQMRLKHQYILQTKENMENYSGYENIR
jgi:hypothetical protein